MKICKDVHPADVTDDSLWSWSMARKYFSHFSDCTGQSKPACGWV